MELHIITVCLALLAIGPVRELRRGLANWIHRRRAHREHIRQLEAEHE